MRDAYESSQSLGSTTVLTAVMDNSTKIHGKLHPMIAVCSIGDCEILILRRTAQGALMPIFHTEMQRIDGNAQSPLQLARVDDSVDPNFDPDIMIEVIERGIAVHCVSAYEGDIVVLGSDGVFDNLFVEEIVGIATEMLIDPADCCSGTFAPLRRSALGEVAKRIVLECHAKTQPPFHPSPIGKGGKVDDTSCVVGEVVEWTNEHSEAWAELRRQRWWGQFATCGGFHPCEDELIVGDDYDDYQNGQRNYPQNPNASFSTSYWGSFNEFGGSFANLASGYGSVRLHEMGTPSKFSSKFSRDGDGLQSGHSGFQSGQSGLS